MKGGALIHTVLVDQKKSLGENQMLAQALAKVYSRNAEIIDWPNSTCELKNAAEAALFKEKW